MKKGKERKRARRRSEGRESEKGIERENVLGGGGEGVCVSVGHTDGRTNRLADKRTYSANFILNAVSGF